MNDINKITVRVKRLLDRIETAYTSLDVQERSYGFSVSYIDGLGDRQLITIYVLSGLRTSYLVRWDTNGNKKLRLPA